MTALPPIDYPPLAGRYRHYKGGTYAVIGYGRHSETLEPLVLYCSEEDGKPIPRGYFGPWPKHYCDGDLWGYGHESMEALRADLAGSPAVATPQH